MSKLIANWEFHTKTRNDKIVSLIKLINEAKRIFFKTPELALAANRLAVQTTKQFDVTCDDFLLYLFAHQRNSAARYGDLRAFVERFFEVTLPLIFKNFNSFQIGQSDYINIISTNHIALLYLERTPLTNVFALDNLRLKPFAYLPQEIKMIKQLITFVNSHNNNPKTLVMNFFSFTFLSSSNHQKALAIRQRFIEKISSKLSLQSLELNSVNYEVLLKKIKNE